MAHTDFTETKALLIAIEDAEVDSGVYAVDEYLRENFLYGELRRLENAADTLAFRARVIAREKREAADRWERAEVEWWDG